MIAAFNPDIAHVRNIYHHLSPSILWELKARGVKVLYHLNDLKLICPAYNMVAHGAACELCQGGRFGHVVTSGCYEPKASAAVLAMEAYVHRWLGTYERCIHSFLAPSEFVKGQLAKNGFDLAKISVLPHFQELPAAPVQPPTPDAPVLYFGRLSKEKGVHDLLRAMAGLPQLRLQIAGDGPERSNLQLLAAELRLRNVQFLGHQQQVELQRLISAAQFTIFPSRAYETMGKAILESYACGRAVVASDLGSRREFVHEGKTGLLFPAGDVQKLRSAMSFLAERPALAAELGESGRKLVEAQHSPESHYAAMMRLYEQMSRSTEKKVATMALRKNPRLRVAFIGGRG